MSGGLKHTEHSVIYWQVRKYRRWRFVHITHIKETCTTEPSEKCTQHGIIQYGISVISTFSYGLDMCWGGTADILVEKKNEKMDICLYVTLFESIGHKYTFVVFTHSETWVIVHYRLHWEFGKHSYTDGAASGATWDSASYPWPTDTWSAGVGKRQRNNA